MNLIQTTLKSVLRQFYSAYPGFSQIMPFLGLFRTKIPKSNALSVIWPNWLCTNCTTGVISFKTLRLRIKYFIQTTKWDRKNFGGYFQWVDQKGLFKLNYYNPPLILTVWYLFSFAVSRHNSMGYTKKIKIIWNLWKVKSADNFDMLHIKCRISEGAHQN